jgi:hypothetical protein
MPLRFCRLQRLPQLGLSFTKSRSQRFTCFGASTLHVSGREKHIESYHIGRLHYTGVHTFIPSIIKFWSMYYSRTKKRAVVGSISRWVLVTRMHGVLHCALVFIVCTTSQSPTIWANACHEQDRHGPEGSRRTQSFTSCM